MARIMSIGDTEPIDLDGFSEEKVLAMAGETKFVMAILGEISRKGNTNISDLRKLSSLVENLNLNFSDMIEKLGIKDRM